MILQPSSAILHPAGRPAAEAHRARIGMVLLAGVVALLACLNLLAGAA